MSKTPLLILSDAPTSGTGLGRITRDLATRIAENMQDTFRVATVGYGGVVSRHLPFHQYIAENMSGDWVVKALPEIWADWAGEENGILLTIWDLSRIGWLTDPKMNCQNAHLRDFLLKKPFQLWTYLPIDAEGPHQKMTFPLAQYLAGSDRILAYGKWGAGVVDRTLGVDGGTTQWLPHGIDTQVFYPRDRAWSRKTFPSYTRATTLMGNLAERVKSEEVLISIVGTNQARKDWGLGIEVVAKLALSHNIRLWVKTDEYERHWSIPALVYDHGLADRTMFSLGDMTDDEMARAYSASDLVLGIAPEGFGYVHVESTACGTPCIVGSYAGGAELVPEDMQVIPTAYRKEGPWSSVRPVYNARKWADVAEDWIGKSTTLFPQYDWGTLWPAWCRWLKEGVE